MLGSLKVAFLFQAIIFSEMIKALVDFMQQYFESLTYFFDFLYLRSRLLQSLFSFRFQGHANRIDKNYAKMLGQRCGLKVDDVVVTEDGYVLTMHRLRVGNESITDPSRIPVLFLHGLMLDSESFLRDSRNNLASYVATNGYDVWLGNHRGNKYSLNHLHLSANADSFWDFSMDEFVQYDFPSMISSMLLATGASSVVCVCFSQGCIIALTALSREPSLSNVISQLVLLSPPLRTLTPKHVLRSAQVFGHLDISTAVFGKRSFLGCVNMWQRALSKPAFAYVVKLAMNILFEWKCSNISNRRCHDLFETVYSPTSVKCAVHWCQLIAGSTFVRKETTTKNLGAFDDKKSIVNTLFSALRSKLSLPVGTQRKKPQGRVE